MIRHHLDSVEREKIIQSHEYFTLNNMIFIQNKDKHNFFLQRYTQTRLLYLVIYLLNDWITKSTYLI